MAQQRLTHLASFVEKRLQQNGVLGEKLFELINQAGLDKETLSLLHGMREVRNLVAHPPPGQRLPSIDDLEEATRKGVKGLQKMGFEVPADYIPPVLTIEEKARRKAAEAARQQAEQLAREQAAQQAREQAAQQAVRLRQEQEARQAAARQAEQQRVAEQKAVQAQEDRLAEALNTVVSARTPEQQQLVEQSQALWREQYQARRNSRKRQWPLHGWPMQVVPVLAVVFHLIAAAAWLKVLGRPHGFLEGLSVFFVTGSMTLMHLVIVVLIVKALLVSTWIRRMSYGVIIATVSFFWLIFSPLAEKSVGYVVADRWQSAITGGLLATVLFVLLNVNPADGMPFLTPQQAQNQFLTNVSKRQRRQAKQ